MTRELQRVRLGCVAAGFAALVTLVTACDQPPPVESTGEVTRERAEVPVAGDGPTAFTAIVETEGGPRELGDARDLYVDPEAPGGPWVAVLRPDPERAWAGTLHIGPADALRPVADRVARGIAGCRRTSGPVVAVARARGEDPTDRALWTVTESGAREHPLDAPLDRVIGLSPDCRVAVVVLRERGLPVIAAVALNGEGDSVVTRLANHDLDYDPGAEPQGFVPPPEQHGALAWDGARAFHYTSDGQLRRFVLPGSEGPR